jgi:hypothetical protein
LIFISVLSYEEGLGYQESVLEHEQEEPLSLEHSFFSAGLRDEQLLPLP